MEQLKYLIDRVQSIDDKFDDKLDRILIQTTRTNGRVTALEEKLTIFESSQDRTRSEVESLRDNKNEIKGRDKTIYIILVCAGTFVGIMIEHFFFKP